MRRMWGWAAGLLLLGMAATASASTITVDNIDDPLHGYCTGCLADNGAITPDPLGGPVTNFGFTVSPGSQTGTYYLAILVPNNEDTVALNTTGIALTGTGVNGQAVVNDSGVATLATSTQWTSGTLPDFLSANAPQVLGSNVSSSPANPIGAYLNNNVTLAVDSGATGFFVFTVNLGTNTLNGPSLPGLAPLDTTSGPLPAGSVILGFLNTGTQIIGTANSGAILYTNGGPPPPPPPPPPAVPEPGSMVLLGTGLLFAAKKFRR